MKRFLAVMKHDGGCDYTIGCGVRVEEFTAVDMEAAQKKALKSAKRLKEFLPHVEVFEIAGPAVVVSP
jgi:hypothetical protein